MSITRLEMNYYKNIERIAVALEKMVAQTEQTHTTQRYDRISAASKLIYGNSKSPLKNNPGTGRSDDNYTYPQFVQEHYESSSTINNFKPTITNDQDERIYKESQSITGGEFSNWYNKLNDSEKQSYQRIYGH